ncbi:Retrovirus-related Pol polyprotein from transposon TNT 1-94 [Vitis vinifera]|uniref:Retrovirus-related Pol polyprotein from transposon TNT 1-94 n=1 Tax=Vitis vinifera TaxID=29760 RepID=A0A438ISL2_VITVI|nr:Retrovirus-related Pol polyprotein from transposon TNT 1-94 [Vitis vinifera]
MEESSLTVALSILDGDNYETWAVRMTVHLQALDVWEAVEENYEVPPLGANPTVAQMKLHKERRTRKAKAKACLFAAVSPSIFIKIMKIDSAAEIWEYLKEEYKGDERIKNMQVMNLIREFEMKKMRESDAVKDYAAQLLSIADKVRLLGKEFSNEKIVQKILVTLPEKYEATISSLENSKDLSTISLTELLHSLEAVEQRRLMRQGDTAEGAFQARMQKNADVKCNKCGKQGHVERICKNQQQEETNAVVDYCQEEQLFAATCFANKSTSKSWLVDSGCTNHMTNNQDLFRELDRTTISKVRIGNGEYIPVKGKGTVAIESQTGLKLIYDVLFVPDIDQNLLSVGQLVEKEFKVYFEDRNCIIKDAEGKEVFNIKMKGKSFALNLLEDEHTAILQQDSTTMFWDRRVEHFHHDDVLYMKKNQIVEGLPDLEKDLPICATCQYGKQTKLPFPKKISWRATQKLQLVHTDVGGSQKMPSLKWNANNVWWISKNAILEMECKQFWAKTASRAVYFLNILPTKVLKKQTPFEVWFECLRARLGVCIYEVKEEC